MNHEWREGEIFVFGSNLAGIHGAGAAKTAYKRYGARWNQGMGLHGQSYALPTKDRALQTLPLGEIRTHIRHFLCFAQNNPTMKFFLTRIGCGLAGYTDAEIAPLFEDAPSNVRKPEGW